MNPLAPGWVDKIASSVKGSEKERAEALGVKPRYRFRIDLARLHDSAAAGGRKGGKAPKKARAK